MILNDKEKAELIKAIKQQYNYTKDLLDNPEYELGKDENARKSLIAYCDELKERYETLENQEVCEVTINQDFFKGDNSWWAIIGLAILFGLGGNNPENNSNLN